MNDSVLHSDMRAVIANDLALGVGKELGITKAEIKKRLAKSSKKRHNRIMWRHYPIGLKIGYM